MFRLGPGLAAGWALLGVLCVLSPSRANASPPDLFGYGGRSPALAMTGASYVEGYEAVFMNPAGLGPVRRRSLTVGFQAGNYNLRIDGERSPLTPPRGMVIGFALPLPFGDVLEDRLTFGGAFFTPAEVLLRGKVQFPAVPQWAVLDRAQAIGLMVGMGFDFHDILDGLHLGVGVIALADVFAELDVRLDETNAFSSVVDLQLVTTFAPTLGVRFTQDEWGIGLTYRHESLSRMNLAIHTADLPIEVPVLNVGGIVQYDPSTILAEGYWRPTPDVMLILNLTTRLWNFYPGTQIPTTTMGRNAPDPDFAVMPSPRVAVEGGWRDDNFEFVLRGGYAFEPTPAPAARMAPRRTAAGEAITDEIVPFRLLDSHRHVLTGGFGWTILSGDSDARVVLDVYAQLHVLQSRTHEIGITDGAPPMVTDGTILVGGWTARLEF